MWQQSRGRAAWVIMVDIDEFIYHPNLLGYLYECKQTGVTAIEAIAYEMITDTFPSADLPLTQTVTCGVREPFYDKLCIFNPNAIACSNFRPGRHTAAPTGRVRWPIRARREAPSLQEASDRPPGQSLRRIEARPQAARFQLPVGRAISDDAIRAEARI